MELILYDLLWMGEIFIAPSHRQLGESFEGWAYRNGLLERIRKLQAGEYLEDGEREGPGVRVADTILRLSEEGRLRALGGRDPEQCWNRGWDGKWRIVMFDIPEKRRDARQSLRRFLSKSHFGRVQWSGWLSPDPIGPVLEEISRSGGDPSGLLTWHGQPASGENDLDIVQSAWGFDAINLMYEAYLKQLEQFPAGSSFDAVIEWVAEERAAWMGAIELDPLLPRELLPEGYLGREAWEKRKGLLARLAKG